MMQMMTATVTSAWSLERSARNISRTVPVFIFSVRVSRTAATRTSSAMTNSPATIRATRANPSRSCPCPSAMTACMVKTVMRALPMPAQVLPTTDSRSRSSGLVVTAGIMDQYGISIMV